MKENNQDTHIVRNLYYGSCMTLVQCLQHVGDERRKKSYLYY